LAGVLGLAAPAVAEPPAVSLGGQIGFGIPGIRSGATDILSQDVSSRRGLFFGLLLRARARTSGSSLIYLDSARTQPVTPSPVSFDAETNVKDSLRRGNVGITAGGGYRHRAGVGEVVVEAHFELGLTTIQRDVTTSGSNETGAVVATVGYLFPLRRGGS
jgi:hypothetical protein